jgi:acetylornithine deacetylase/succinyl-diaminopimelate desuccinylase-like protein
MVDVQAALRMADQRLDRSVEQLFELVRIPSVSSDPVYRDECRRAAAWLVDALTALGFDAGLRETPGHPVVIGHFHRRDRSSRAAHVLFYGHYDVQPPDPIDRWTTPPFEPRRVAGPDGRDRLVGRGMADDKGQLWTFIEACRALLAVDDDLPADITLFLEGEEECGSPSLLDALRRCADQLRCDVAYICDSGMWDADTPAITCRLRGLLHERIVIDGPTSDLHSGLYGGIAANPLTVLARILGRLHHPDGRVAIPGFYDDIRDVPQQTLREWASLGVTARDILAEVGLSVPILEPGRSIVEQMWARPSLDINGIHGGNAGPGERSVLPAQASARLSIRLVGDQDPDRVRAQLRSYVAAMVPADCRVAFEGEGGSGAIAVPESSPYLSAAAEALAGEWGRRPILKGSGGTIPVVRYLKDVLDLDSVMVGFGLSDDAIHAPNEKYDLRCLHKGIRSWIRILAGLSPARVQT